MHILANISKNENHRKTIPRNQFHISDATHLVDEALQVFEIL